MPSLTRRTRSIDYLMGGAPGNPNPDRTIGTGDLEPTETWRVRRLMLSRPKVASGTELVKREARRTVWGAADPETEWYVQVAVYSGVVVAFVGEVTLPDDGDNPQDELNAIVEKAHRRADFLNRNVVELPGDRVVDGSELGRGPARVGGRVV